MSKKVSPDEDEEVKDEAGDEQVPAPLGDDEESEKETSSDEDSESVESTSKTGLTENQNRLLYLISLYTHAARTEDEQEEWIRKTALLVLIYEGIVLQVLDYDYAPACEIVEESFRYFNVSQEGKSDIDFLREEELINILKISSKSYRPVACFQVSEKGEDMIQRLGKQDKEAVHELVFAPGTRQLLKVQWEKEKQNFFLVSNAGYSRKTTVMETEDISYVSSAYVPQCLRHGGRPTLSNAHRAHECGQGESAIKDELDEIITLSSVSLIVAEYVPFGANNLVQLNINIGSNERVQGGLISNQIDSDSMETNLAIKPGLTSINILDYTLSDHCNFEADIHYPVDEGVVQVEVFGVSANADGTMFYGMQVEAVMERIKDNISLDHLSRLLVDVHLDSSKIIDSVLSPYQRKLLDLVFLENAEHRDKINLVVANEITPHLTAEEYMDKGEYENELKQIIGDTRAAYDISEHDTLVFGAHGLLIAGPNSRHHEPLLCAYLQLNAADVFVQSFFNRLYILLDDMRRLRSVVKGAAKDPNAIATIREEVVAATEKITLLEEVLGFLREAISDMALPPQPSDQAGRGLYERLELAEMKDQLMRRTGDLVKNVSGGRQQLELVREMANFIREEKVLANQEGLASQMEKLDMLSQQHERSTATMQTLQVMVAGIFAFHFLDRITGSWSVVNTSWMVGISEVLLVSVPGLWFAINLTFFGVVLYVVKRLLRKQQHTSEGVMTLRMNTSRKLNIENLNKYLQLKGTAIANETRTTLGMNEMVNISWVEPDKREWGYYAPRITLQYDEKNKYLLSVVVKYNRRMAKKNLAFNAQELKERLQSDFDAGEIFEDSKMLEAKELEDSNEEANEEPPPAAPQEPAEEAAENQSMA